MKYIEIQDGITININSIETVERLEGNKSKVYAHKRVYESTYPYETLLSMLKEEETISKKVPSEELITRTMKKLDSVLNKQEHFGG